MAKLIVEMDTETNEMTVTVDGQKIKNADYFSGGMRPDYDSESEGEDAMKCCFNISTKTISDTGVKTYTNICASKSEAGKASIAMGSKEIIPGVVEDLITNKVPGPVKASKQTLDKIKNFLKGNR